MASRIVAAARQAATVSRISTTHQPSLFIQRRGLAAAADHHGPAKVNCWQDPTSPSKWKEEHVLCGETSFAITVILTLCKPSGRAERYTGFRHDIDTSLMSSDLVSMMLKKSEMRKEFVLVSLSGWGLLIYGGFKLFSGGKEKEEKVADALH
ncbi:hypothetical protein KSS87_011250 [Heliosperma pusillum]|nr:hypothetical protein KSS87_011250 [Heliosperma pusillum]